MAPPPRQDTPCSLPVKRSSPGLAARSHATRSPPPQRRPNRERPAPSRRRSKRSRECVSNEAGPRADRLPPTRPAALAGPHSRPDQAPTARRSPLVKLRQVAGTASHPRHPQRSHHASPSPPSPHGARHFPCGLLRARARRAGARHLPRPQRPDRVLQRHRPRRPDLHRAPKRPRPAPDHPRQRRCRRRRLVTGRPEDRLQHRDPRLGPDRDHERRRQRPRHAAQGAGQHHRGRPIVHARRTPPRLHHQQRRGRCPLEYEARRHRPPPDQDRRYRPIRTSRPTAGGSRS